MLYNMNEHHQKLIESQRKEQQEEQLLGEMEQCTFKPDTNSSSKYASKTSDLPVETRTKIWEKQRQAKIEGERKIKEDPDEEECTFKP